MSLSSLIFNSIMRDFHFLVYLYIKHWSSKTYNAFRLFRRIESQLRLTLSRSSCKFMRRKSPLYQLVHQNCFPSRFVTIIERGMLHQIELLRMSTRTRNLLSSPLLSSRHYIYHNDKIIEPRGPNSFSKIQ